MVHFKTGVGTSNKGFKPAAATTSKKDEKYLFMQLVKSQIGNE